MDGKQKCLKQPRGIGPQDEMNPKLRIGKLKNGQKKTDR
jgi:hypothetical protein